LRDNRRLDQLELRNVDLGIERAHTFALGSTSITKLHFGDNNLGDDGFASIAAALSKQTQLERLSLRDNSLGATSCKALEPMVSIFPRLSYLDLSYNIIDDTGLEALVGGLSKSNSVEKLYLSGNRLITVEGLRSFSTLFRSENCSLKSLTLEEMNIGDDEAEVLANGLTGNKSLRGIYFSTNTITARGWSVFSRLLCDTSSISNTYLSNHTLDFIGDHRQWSEWDINRYIKWNKGPQRHNLLPWYDRDRRIVPKPQISKILFCHRDLDLEPFFRYKLKFLPVVFGWLQRAEPFLDYQDPGIECRKLAAMYKFMRVMPQLVADGYWAHVLKETLEKKRKLLLELDALDETEKSARKRVKH